MSSPTSDHEKLLESWQYIASPDFPSYPHWEAMTPTSNELRDPDDDPATLIIVGQAVSDKLAVAPLGNYQSQEEKQQRYQESYSNRDATCLNAKLVVIIRRPSADTWKGDYTTATTRLDTLQEKVAKGAAPRQYLLDYDHKPPFVRLTFPLWEKKKYTKSREKYLDDKTSEEDETMRALREDHDARAKQTAEYGSYVPGNCIDAFRTASETHHIRLAPVFFPNGKRVPADELAICLENALIEVMFSLKHYYYGPPTLAAGHSKFKTPTSATGKVGNTFTGTIQQVKILQINTVVPSPLGEPTMKPAPRTPSRKDKYPGGIRSKRPNSLPLPESSPSPSKKNRPEVTSVTNAPGPSSTSSSSSTFETSSQNQQDEDAPDDGHQVQKTSLNARSSPSSDDWFDEGGLNAGDIQE